MMHALVLAEVNRPELELAFPEIEFDYKGYAKDFLVLDHEELGTIIGCYDILISEFDTVDQTVLDKATNLKLIICCRGGVDSVIDVEYARLKGIAVRNTPGRNATAVAEYVIGQIISQDRHLSETDCLIHNDVLQKEHYSKPSEYRDSLWGMDSKSPYHRYRGRGLDRVVLGVIGYGRVGRVVTEMAGLLGMHVVVYDHSLQEVKPELDVRDFEPLLAYADIVSLHCTNPSRRPLFDYDTFHKMKAGAWLINTARGDLLDEEALIAVLEEGYLGRAIIDVTCQEPLPPGNKLLQAPNLVITPHIAGATDAVIENVTKMVIAYIRQFNEGLVSK